MKIRVSFVRSMVQTTSVVVDVKNEDMEKAIDHAEKLALGVDEKYWEDCGDTYGFEYDDWEDEP